MNTQTNPTAHVRGEKIENLGRGKLEYSPAEGMSGTVIFESVVFILLRSGVDRIELGRCDKYGNILPESKELGISGYVTPNGYYKFTSIKGIRLVSDVIYVNYDYEFDIPYMVVEEGE